MDKNYAYITLLSSDDFLTGVKLVKYSLNAVGSEYPLICMVTESVSDATIEQLELYDIVVERVSTIPMPDDLMRHNTSVNPGQAAIWKDTFTKYHMFHFTDYSKLIFVDADIYFMKNTDHLFECPHMTAALDGEGFDIWPVWPHFNSGFVVIEPNNDLFHSLVEFVNRIDVTKCTGLIADQEVLNYYYNDWPLRKKLHLDKYHNVFSPYLTAEYTHVDTETKQDLIDNAVFFHFIGKKPWQENNRNCWGIKELQFIRPIVDKMLAEESNFPKVCVYTICKNEEKNVEHWYETVKDADAICVIDTGSTDTTWDKLQACGDNMYIDKYVYDGDFNFSEARNFSLDKACTVCNYVDADSEWIYVTVDLDEFLETDAISKIKQSWNSTYDTMTLHCFENDVDIVKDHKIHSSDDWSWFRTVHEMIRKDTKTRKEWNIGRSSISLQHIQNQDKPRDYYKLLKQDISQYSEDVVTLVGLAWEAMDHNDWDDSLEYSERAIEVITEDEDNELYLDYPTLLQCYLNCSSYWRHLGDYENELLALDAAILVIENGDVTALRKPYILRALARTNANDINGAIQDYNTALNIVSVADIWVEEACYYDDSIAYYQLADAYCRLSDLKTAKSYIDKAVELKPEVFEYNELYKWLSKYVTS